jgi:SAM-dependent methyltransferase
MTTAAQEQDKYRRIWEVPGYRVKSPGELLVPTFLQHAEWEKGETLIDLGCGSGRAGFELSKAGLNVTLMDITHNALDVSFSKGQMPFIQHCLWEPPTIHFDWAYCCDVLEHIPPEHVDAVLDNIAHMGFWGAFMQIALWPEGWGDKIGETLHLTIKSASWWREQIEKRWPIEWQETSDDDRLIVLTGAPW